MICFNCGCWGHDTKECPELSKLQGPEMEQDVNPLHDPKENNMQKLPPELEEQYGDWMLVRKPARKRPQKMDRNVTSGGRAVATEPPDHQEITTGRPPQNLNNLHSRAAILIKSDDHGAGSRFAILVEENEEVKENEKTIPFSEEVVESPEESLTHKTVNLGESSQFRHTKETTSLSFNLGKDNLPKNKKIEATPKLKTIPPKSSSN